MLWEPTSQVPFFTICATSLPTTHFAHTEKNTLQDENNHIIQTKLSYNWKLKVEVPFTTMFFFISFLQTVPHFHACTSLLLLIEHWKYWHTQKHTATNWNWTFPPLNQYPLISPVRLMGGHHLFTMIFHSACTMGTYPLLNQWLLVWNFGIWNRFSSWYGIIYLKSTLTQPIFYSFVNTLNIIWICFQFFD